MSESWRKGEEEEEDGSRERKRSNCEESKIMEGDEEKQDQGGGQRPSDFLSSSFMLNTRSYMVSLSFFIISIVFSTRPRFNCAST